MPSPRAASRSSFWKRATASAGGCGPRIGIDLGAHWIHGTEGNPITNLARELGVPTLFVGGDSSYTGGWEQLQLWSGGQPLSQELKERSITLIDEIRDAIEAFRRDLELSGGPDVSLASAIEMVTAGRGLSAEMRNHIAWHMLVVSRDDWAAGTDRLSTLWWDDGYEVYGYGDSVFVDGVGSLVEKLAEGLDIRCGAVVRRIEHGEEGVRVSTDAAAYEADAVIVTLPLGVLKSGAVRFDPPLPERKRQAIARLGMGTLTKVILTFESAFWPPNQYVFGHLSGDIGETPALIINMWKTHRRPVLVMLIGGEEGRGIEEWSSDAVATWAMRVLADVFGTAAPPPRKVQVTAWGERSIRPGRLQLHRPRRHARRHRGAGHAGGRAADVRRRGDNPHPLGLDAQRLRLGPSRSRAPDRRREPPAGPQFHGEPAVARDASARQPLLQRRRQERRPGRGRRARRGACADSSVFEGISAGDLKVLATMFERRNLADGEILCRAGERADSVFAVASGEIDVYLPDSAAPVARKTARRHRRRIRHVPDRRALRHATRVRTDERAHPRL